MAPSGLLAYVVPLTQTGTCAIQTMCAVSARTTLTACAVHAAIRAMRARSVRRCADTAFGECSHEFHLHCIMKWLSEKREPLCPMCKRPWGTLRGSPSGGHAGTLSGRAARAARIGRAWHTRGAQRIPYVIQT